MQRTCAATVKRCIWGISRHVRWPRSVCWKRKPIVLRERVRVGSGRR
jgi:hypothetical protein